MAEPEQPRRRRVRDPRKEMLATMNARYGSTIDFRIDVKVPNLLAIAQTRVPRLTKRMVRAFSTNQEAETLGDLFTSDLSPLAKRLVFSFGFMLVFIGQTILLQYPSGLGLFYASLVLPLLTARLISYYANKQIFFFFEYSTVNAILLALTVLIFRKSDTLWKLSFVASNGIVLWSVIPWRNSLTFSSMGSIASFYVHFLPAVVSYAERHGKPANGQYTYMCPNQMPGTPNCPISIAEAFIYPTVVAFVWNIAYIALTEGLFSKEIYNNDDPMTSLKYAVQQRTQLFVQLSKLAQDLRLIKRGEELDLEGKRALTVAMYAGGQFIVSVFLASISTAVFHNQMLHALYLFSFLALLVWNGARETYPDEEGGARAKEPMRKKSKTKTPRFAEVQLPTEDLEQSDNEDK